VGGADRTNDYWDRTLVLANGATFSVPETFWELVVQVAETSPDTLVAVDDHGRSLTRLGLLVQGERVAAALAARGIGPGSVVSWQLPSTIEAFVLLVALNRVGAVQNPIIPILRQKEVGFITKHVGATAFIAPTRWRGFDHIKMAQAVCDPTVDLIALDMDDLDAGGLSLPASDDLSPLPPPPEPGGVRFFYFSSGTTADPKGIRHTDLSVMSACSGMVSSSGFGATDRYPIAWPLTHIGGSTMLCTSLVAGTTLVLFDAYDPMTTPERMAAHHPTLLGSAVPFFRAFLDAQKRHGDEPLFPELRAGACGGAPIPAEIHAEMRAAFGVPLLNSYGLTEFPIATSATATDSHDVLTTSVGRVSPGVLVRAVDSEGAVAGPGVEGEIRVKGPQCFVGYINSSLDEAAFDDEGWFRTGDLGTIDTDGVVRITGRLKDIVIRNAENISVVEIEELLFRYPAIEDGTVFGMPDNRTGERVCAVVVLRPEGSVTLEDLRAFCRAEGLSMQKCPEQLEFATTLPRNAMGKVLKQQLRAELLAGATLE
jgi:cyclohexanecarboxylate-CoA ligase